MWKNKKVLVAGGAGLIGRQLVDKLLNNGANVRVADLNKIENSSVEELQLDLTVYENCLKACNGIDVVFNLLCVKGSPKAMAERPADHFVPMILFNTNLMRAAKNSGVARYLYSSTLGVYAPAEEFYEDDVWKTFPSENDRFAGWAKRMGELQVEAYAKQYGWKDVAILRPANTYGPHDDFDSDGAMVVPSLIKKALKDSDLKIWGDGRNVRDFIYSGDVADAMIYFMENPPGPHKPINIGSGTGSSIRELAETILKAANLNKELVFENGKHVGDSVRVLNTSRAEELGFSPKVSLEQGIKTTLEWYKNAKK